ncbi:MAG TPA: glycogen debranching N-terminal domain-containing protein, partial [Jatrophihabitantaceae bacterium]|nr:glycogen debranching N-terminal domain-containing protein [Jatrophihabitantaceae bacterium]
MPQPYLHDLVCAVRAPALAVCGADGQIRSEGVHGVYVGDRRIVSLAIWTIDGAEPTPLQGQPIGGDAARFVATDRTLGDQQAVPTVLVRRERTTVHDGAMEQLEVVSYAQSPVRATLSLSLAGDLADLVTVRGGAAASALPAAAQPDGMHWRGLDGRLVQVLADVPPDAVHAEAGRLDWTIDLARGEVFSLHITYRLAEDRGPAIVSAAQAPAFGAPSVVSGDHRLSALVAQSLADLDALLLADPLEPRDLFLSAGAPWYLTLFGRDSIWAARMLLPLGTDLAAGTLRTLARRQGVRSDPETAEQPGKILHEIRRPLADPAAQRHTLPPVYYGTVDATPLWISLLHDAWRWGLPEADVVELLPALESALGWLADYALDSAGFVSYQDASGRGLANQGWKDSFDSVQFRDGRLAAPPIALCEVQAYAHAAARHGADLLDAFGRPGGARWRDWAAALADRFRARFWVGGDYPAIALDG